MVGARTVLVVSEDQAFRESLLGAVEEEGFWAFGAAPSEAILEAVLTETPPALVLWDAGAGASPAPHFPAPPSRFAEAPIPVVVISKRGRPGSGLVASGALVLKVVAHVKKPARLGDLLAVIEEWLPARHRRGA